MTNRQPLGRRCACIAGLSLLSSPALAGYPSLDEASHWQIDAQTFTANHTVLLSGLSKSVQTGAGVFENRLCFESIAVEGVLIDGNAYAFSRSLGQTLTDYPDYRELSGRYEVLGGGSLGTIVLSLAFRFYKDGKFLYSASIDGSTKHNVQLPIRMNYDFKGPNHDVFELAWNKYSVAEHQNLGPGLDPPSAIAQLTYAWDPATVSWDNVDFWSTVPNEVAVTYAALHQLSNPQSIEYTALCRISDAYSKLGAVIWPWSDSGRATTSYTLIFQGYSATPSSALIPTPNAGQSIQSVDNGQPRMPQYPYLGQNQTLSLVMQGDTNSTTPLQVAGKLFQRENGRPLTVNVHYWPDIYPWAASGTAAAWRFDPDFRAASTNGSTVSFREALAGLVGDPGLVNVNVIAESGTSGSVDYQAQLNQRRDFSASRRENVREWQVDLYYVSKADSNLGLMFDAFSGAGNNIEREGAYVSWGKLAQRAAADAWSVNKQYDVAVFAGLHEVGHALNLTHEFGAASASRGLTIMTSPGEGQDYQTLSVELSYGDRAMHWYRNDPEAWTKPGRYGVMMGGDPSTANLGGVVREYQALWHAPRMGDANYNGMVDIVDALAVAQYGVGLPPAQEFYPEVADVNCSGTIDIVDALTIAQFGVGLITTFPCG